MVPVEPRRTIRFISMEFHKTIVGLRYANPTYRAAEAAFWIKKAADQGHVKVQELLDEITEDFN